MAVAQTDRSTERVLELTLISTSSSGFPPAPAPAQVFTDYGNTFQTKTGRSFGTWGVQGAVLSTRGGTLITQVVGTFNTPEGLITSQGIGPAEAIRKTAVTGGTGSFKKASGYVEIGQNNQRVKIHLFNQ
ncbi:hypothetical protein [Streptomyces sp. 1222.5]|uniref:hypothetical protein n=1 Tax=Streptomyces sp. 1222.5 TaxID=1881026 RepID=UPI003EB86917